MPLDALLAPLALGAAPAFPWIGRQHAARPHLLANALEEAHAAAPHLDGLARRLLPALPRRPRASQNLRAIALHRSTAPLLLDDAVTCPWVAMDSQDVRNTLLLDGDHDDWLDRWRALPEGIRPDLVIDPWSGRFHAVLQLADPVPMTRAARMGPQLMADLAGRLLAAAMGAKLLPPGSLVKSPWGQERHLIGHRRKLGQRPAFPELWEAAQAQGLMWATMEGDGPVDLRAIVAALAPSYWEETDRPAARYARARGKPARGEPSALGWRAALFDLTRWWAYDHEERDAGRIADECAAIDARMGWGLPLADISSTARSIGRFMCTTYRPRTALDERRGRDAHLVAGLPLEEAQAVAARETNKARRAATDARLRDGLARLREAGVPLTQAALAKAAGVSLRTVKDRWHEAAGGSGGMVQDGALSGGAARRGASLPPQAAPSLIPEFPSFSVLACQAREESRQQAGAAAMVARLDGLVGRMGRRGACVLRLPPLLPGASPEVREAWWRADAVRRDAERRRDARRERRRQEREREARQARFGAWAARGDHAAWDAYLTRLGHRWDSLADEARARGTAAWERHRLGRRGAFHRAWTEWRAARSAAPDAPLRTTLDSLDLVAAGLPVPEEEAMAAGVRERARARQEAAWPLLDGEPAPSADRHPIPS